MGVSCVIMKYFRSLTVKCQSIEVDLKVSRESLTLTASRYLLILARQHPPQTIHP